MDLHFVIIQVYIYPGEGELNFIIKIIVCEKFDFFF